MNLDEILVKVREARALCDAATPGPWDAEENDRCWQLFAEQRLDGEVVHPWQLVQASKNGYWPEPKDSRFITEARTGWPEALDIIERLVARVQELEASDDVQAGGCGISLEEATSRYPEATAAIVRRLWRGSDLPPAPPPIKMRITASVPVTYDVSPGQIAAYLRAKGWEQSPIKAGAELYEHHGHNDYGEFYRAVWVFTDVSFADWQRRAAELLETVAEVEHRATGEVLRDIAGMEEA